MEKKVEGAEAFPAKEDVELEAKVLTDNLDYMSTF